MAEFTEIFGDTQLSATEETVRAFLELIEDPRGRKDVSNFIYNSDPRVKAADFGKYPIVYIEDYGLSTDSRNMGGNLFNKTLNLELHVVIEDDSLQQKKFYDNISNDLVYKAEFEERQKLGRQGIGQPEVTRNQSFSGIDVKDQPVLRREIELEAPVQFDMEQGGGAEPYG